MRRATRLTAILAALCAVAATGCGNKHETVTQGETEGIYLDVGELKYQIQISRYLNAADVEDRAYLEGLPANAEQPAGDETWFGVFMRVQNESDETVPPARTFEIHDTQENVYRPIPLDTNVNVFAYKPDPIPPKSLIPAPDSAAAEGVIQGSLLLFRMTNESLQNRPLEFVIKGGAGGGEATVDLDV
jgi:hypothetical protein